MMSRTFGLVALVVIGAWTIPAANAQNFQSWVASTGSDGNSCLRVAPCRTFAAAINRTVAGGEVVCADSGDFSSIFINKSLTITCVGYNATNQNSSSPGMVSVETSASDLVILRGLDIHVPPPFTGDGIQLSGAGIFVIEHCRIVSGGSGSSGIAMYPSGPGRLVVKDTTISTTDTAGSTGAGIRITPQGSGSAQVQIARVEVARHVFGIGADGSASTGGINVTVADSDLSANRQDGIVATTVPGKAAVGMTVDLTRSVNNAIGVRAIGANSIVRVARSTVVGNVTGIVPMNGGQVLTSGSNIVEANADNGAFTGTITAK